MFAEEPLGLIREEVSLIHTSLFGSGLYGREKI
jgi:hypothetical protein